MTIVIGYDGRLEGRDAIALGASIGRALDEPLLVACVYQSPETASGLTAAELRTEAERTAEEGAASIAADLERRHVAVLGRSPAQGLHQFAEEERPTVMVVGSSHRGSLGRVLAGTVASRLLAGASCPVAVAPRGFARRAATPIRSIGVGFDDSAESWYAIQHAAALGVAAGATLRVIHALQPVIAPPMAPEESERLTRELRGCRELALNRAAASVSKDLHAEARMLVGDPVRVLELEASRDLGLLVPRSVEFDPRAGGMAARDAVTA